MGIMSILMLAFIYSIYIVSSEQSVRLNFQVTICSMFVRLLAGSVYSVDSTLGHPIALGQVAAGGAVVTS